MLLTLDLVPQTCWFSNVRSVCSSAEWDTIRREVYKLANYRCQICDDIGPKHPIEAHEIWNYNDLKSVQKLKGLIGLCPNCHQVKHFGFARVQGKEAQALNHLMKVNKLSKSEAIEYVNSEFEIWHNRSQKDWKLDIAFLEKFGIDVKKIKKR